MLYPTNYPDNLNLYDANLKAGVVDVSAPTPLLIQYVVKSVNGNTATIKFCVVDVYGKSKKFTKTIGATSKNWSDLMGADWLNSYLGGYIISITGDSIYINTSYDTGNDEIDDEPGTGDTVIAPADYSASPIKLGRVN